VYKDLSAIYRGDDRTIHLHVVNAITGDDINITGWKVYFTIKENKDDSDEDAKIRKDITTHTHPTEGKTDILLTHEDTYILTPGTNFYDIQIKKVDGTIQTFVSGEIDVLEDITRRAD